MQFFAGIIAQLHIHINNRINSQRGPDRRILTSPRIDMPAMVISAQHDVPFTIVSKVGIAGQDKSMIGQSIFNIIDFIIRDRDNSADRSPAGNSNFCIVVCEGNIRANTLTPVNTRCQN